MYHWYRSIYDSFLEDQFNIVGSPCTFQDWSKRKWWCTFPIPPKGQIIKCPMLQFYHCCKLLSRSYFLMRQCLIKRSCNLPKNNINSYLGVTAKYYIHTNLSIKMLFFSLILTQMFLRFLRPYFVNLITKNVL